MSHMKDKHIDQMNAEVEKCQSWIVVNGEEFQCQWNAEHIGCHSTWTKKGKIKWEAKYEC